MPTEYENIQNVFTPSLIQVYLHMAVLTGYWIQVRDIVVPNDFIYLYVYM